MYVVTPSQMREIDARAIKKFKIPGLTLMENAGQAVADQAERLLGKDRLGLELNVCVICGKGNNGGDGLVAARLLVLRGIKVSVFLLGRLGEVKGDAKTNLKKLKKAGLAAVEVTSPKGLKALRKELAGAQLIIDAVFGTGFKGAPEKNIAAVIKEINNAGATVLSVDIPSGVDGETGQVWDEAVRADTTITMGLMKTGLIFYPGRSLAGEVVVADIGFPPRVIKELGSDIQIPEPVQLKNYLPPRNPEGHKGSFGTVLTLAGSLGMTGAAYLTSVAALRSGAGLVYLGIPESLNDIMETKLTEVITKPLPETRTRTLSLQAFDRIKILMSKADAMVLGPGLSIHPETVELVQAVIKELKIPAVLDADALNAVSEKPELLHQPTPLVLTPHYGEMSRLLKANIFQIKMNPLKTAREAAAKFGQVVVLKGAPTITALPDGQAWINPTGNSGMATAGAGDVLAGLIAGLMAQGADPGKAAVLGAYLHGRAGDLAAENKTPYCMTAGDILDNLPPAYKKIMEEL